MQRIFITAVVATLVYGQGLNDLEEASYDGVDVTAILL